MMKRFFEFFKSYWPGILSGILIGTSYIPFPPWALAFCYTPVWIAIVRAQSWKRTFWLAWWSQFLLSLIGFHWIAYVSHEFGHLPWPVAIFLLLLYASAMHLYIPLAAVAIWWIRKMRGLSDLRTLLLLAFLTVLGEIYWPSIFPWNLGYPLYQANLAMAQTAEIIGFQGLSLLVHLSSAAFAWMWLNHRSRLRAGASFAIWLVLAMGLSYWGQGRLRHWQSQETHPLQVMIVQANIGSRPSPPAR